MHAICTAVWYAWHALQTLRKCARVSVGSACEGADRGRAGPGGVPASYVGGGAGSTIVTNQEFSRVLL